MHRRLTDAALIGAFALALLGVSAMHAFAADAEDDDTFEQKIIKKILGQGDEERINYRERSPLVVPPKLDLPPPEAATVPNPAWPKDADAPKAKKKVAAKPRQQDWRSNDDRPLLPSELDKPGGRPARQSSTQPSVSSDGGQRLMPSELGYKGGLFDFFKSKTNEVATYPGEPARSAMTDPPAGYLTPAPTQPYGLTEKQEAPKPWSIYDIGTEKKW